MNAKQDANFRRALIAGLVVLYILSLALLTYGNIRAGDGELWQVVVNGILLSIPLILLYSLVGVLIVVARQRRREGQIHPRLARLIYWSPRIGGIVMIAFASLFALDVFSPEYTLGEMLLGFLMHMLPMIAMAVLLAFAWRWPWVGCMAFTLAALFFMRGIFFDPLQGLGTSLIFGGPLLLIALLFGANALWQKDLRPSAPALVG